MSKRSKRSKKGRKQKPSTVSSRKLSRGERLDAAVRGARAVWLKHEEALKVIEAAASEDPLLMAGDLLEKFDRQRRLCARYLRLRFGTEVQATEDDDPRAIVTEISEGNLRIVGRGDWNPVAALLPVRPERYPRNLGEKVLFERLVHEYARTAFTVGAMLDAGRNVKAAGYDDEDMTWVTCQVFLSIYRLRVCFSAALVEEDLSSHPVLREIHTTILAGWVGSKISLKRNKRLSSALADQGERPFDVLLRELPAATLTEWATAGRDGPVENLINSVTSSLEKLGREAVISNKVRDEPPEEAVVTPEKSITFGEDDDLAEFEREETLRQQRDQLRRWIEEAGFSEQERRVYALDMRTNYDTEAIARDLNIVPESVRTYRKRYHDKIRKVRKAAGF